MSTTHFNTTQNPLWSNLTTPAPEKPTNELPPELKAEMEQNYQNCNINAYITDLVLNEESARNGKIRQKLELVEKRRDDLQAIREFLEEASLKLSDGKATTFNFADLKNPQNIENIRRLVGGKTAELFNQPQISRRHLEHIVQVLTRHQDGQLSMDIKKIQDEISDDCEKLNLILGVLKEIGKRYNDHIDNIIRLMKAQ
jgi:hypothetical protein